MAIQGTPTESRLWSLGILALAAVSLPYVLTLTLLVAAWYRLVVGTTDEASYRVSPSGKTAIVTGGKMTKALCTCRHLKRAGCRVVLIETHKYWMVAARFSKCVDRFVTVPVPEQDPEGYRAALKVLAYEEDADLFVPVSSPVASTYDASVASVLPPGCRSLSLGEAVTAALDDKVTFASLAKSVGLPVPDTVRMSTKEEIHAFNDALREKGAAATRYILKNLAYDSMRRLDCFTMPCEPASLAAYISDIEITPSAPWTAQQLLQGPEYSTCAIAHEGATVLYTDNLASISCFNYEYQGDAEMRAWVEGFVRAHSLSGVLCIDFMRDDAGRKLAIECNPRMSSNVTNFHNASGVGHAFLRSAELAKRGECVTPLPSAGESNWLAVDLYYALRTPGLGLAERARQLYEALACKKDSYFEPDDVLPFLALHFLHIPVLLARNVWRGNRWAKIDMCIGKMTEENGD